MDVRRQELLDELNKELHFLQNGGTSYRQETAELSLKVVSQVQDPAVFRDRLSAFETANRLLGQEDSQRVMDVSKMISVVASDLHRQKKQPLEMKEYVEQKRKNRKPLAFVTK